MKIQTPFDGLPGIVLLKKPIIRRNRYYELRFLKEQLEGSDYKSNEIFAVGLGSTDPSNNFQYHALYLTTEGQAYIDKPELHGLNENRLSRLYQKLTSKFENPHEDPVFVNMSGLLELNNLGNWLRGIRRQINRTGIEKSFTEIPPLGILLGFYWDRTKTKVPSIRKFYKYY